jgi:hypothetical protein
VNVIYQDTDITNFVIPSACDYKDVSHGKADTLDISFRRSAAWHRWQPEIDDTIQITEGKFDTGILYVNTIVPSGNAYRILASSLPSKATRKAWGAYRDMTLADIVHRCAAECGMKERLYGVDGNVRYPFLMRQNEGCAAFLERLMKCEGVALKAWSGSFRGIGIEYAQELDAIRSWDLDAEQTGVKYQHQPGRKYTSVTVRSPWAEATARDSGAEKGYQITVSDLPAMDNVQAGRWARGLLLCHNRETDRLSIELKLDTAVTAMTRANITGNTDANGEWIIDEVEHDLYNKRTSVSMLRVIRSVR